MAQFPVWEKGDKMAGKRVNITGKGILKGSSIVEAVTASVIFLLLFALALHAVVEMGRKEVRPAHFIEADKAYRKVLDGCVEGMYTVGNYPFRYEWGAMDLCLETYGDAGDLVKVSVTLRMKSNTSRIIHRHIIKPQNPAGI